MIFMLFYIMPCVLYNGICFKNWGCCNVVKFPIFGAR